MEIIKTLLYAIWEWLELLAYIFWKRITLIPEAIGLPEWTVIAIGIIVIVILAIIIIQRIRN